MSEKKVSVIEELPCHGCGAWGGHGCEHCTCERMPTDVRAALEREAVRALATVGVHVTFGGQPQHPRGVALYFCQDDKTCFRCAEAFRKAGLRVEALPCTPGGQRGLSLLVMPAVGACPACGAEPGTNIDCKRCMSGVDGRKPPSATVVVPNEPGTYKVGMATGRWAGKTAEMHRAIGAAVASGKSVCVVSPDKTVVARPEVVATAPLHPSETCMLCPRLAPSPRPICEACDAALGEKGEPLSSDAYYELGARTRKALEAARMGCTPTPWFSGTRGPVLACGNAAFLADASRALEAAGLGWEVLDSGRDLLRALPAAKAKPWTVAGVLKALRASRGSLGVRCHNAFGHAGEAAWQALAQGERAGERHVVYDRVAVTDAQLDAMAAALNAADASPAVPFCERHRTHGNTCSDCEVEAGRLVLAEPKVDPYQAHVIARLDAAGDDPCHFTASPTIEVAMRRAESRLASRDFTIEDHETRLTELRRQKAELEAAIAEAKAPGVRS